MKKITSKLELAVCLLILAGGVALVVYFGGKLVNHTPKRTLLELGYMPIINDSTKQVGRVTGYTIDAIYLDGMDTVTVTGLTQSQYDSLQISE